MTIHIDTQGTATIHAVDEVARVMEHGGLAALITATTTDAELDLLHAAAEAGNVGPIVGLRAEMSWWRDLLARNASSR
ncbi:hypothetical protein PP568_06890 [Mycobacteroides abscessus]|uniref:Uncharacterized protein n=1 Tax=Mycobacteroides abscessus subsp. abscessus TaxID=1185650 RepID=A0AB38D3I3_9MYCO|nr:hypothetical protein [Mycobacteroides abscessus]MBE5419581.1 hypothetical protein [Mycobacteroides abscessus]MBE5455720.1 hypothetical protein [Mycobacteroides abscessus]MBN7461897.1 hypothetical protein [Mycobacteroides abscessus subsp. abscessus]MBN7555265.1 hypothetical protein [Mycobacteroides abscessus subsp. abscessus]MDM2404657.1 hypothetical protein [Mycobacteroides abscessus]